MSHRYREKLGFDRVILVPTTTADARTRLLAVARRRFAHDGALSATLDDVRREAEVSVGALYHHFPNKLSLATAVYAQLLSEYQAGFIAMLREHDTAEGGVRGGVRYHLGWVAARRGEATLLLGSRLDSAELRQSNSAFFASVGDWWRPHQAYGVLRPLNIGITAALWLGPAQEFSRHWVAGSAAKLPRGAVETFADAAWAALRANESEV
jgi:AcrR family transcriptional regulator